MSLRFMRRVSILPGVRLNFSRSGISTTIGVRGASLTLGGKRGPTANLGLPGTGLSLRLPLKPLIPSSNGTGGHENPHPDREVEPVQSQEPVPTNYAPIRAMKAIQSEAVGNITTPGLASLHDLIASAQQQRDAAEKIVCDATQSLERANLVVAEAHNSHDQAEQRLARLEASFFKAFRKGTIAAIKTEIAQSAQRVTETINRVQEALSQVDEAKQHRDELWVNTEFTLSGPAHGAWTKLTAAFTTLSRSQRIWDITASRDKRPGEERSAAIRVVERTPVQLSISELPIIQSEYEALRWQNANGGELFLYPAFLIVYQSNLSFALLDLNEVTLNFEATRYNEADPPPSDAKQVGTAWTYANRDGSPDQRFAKNPSMPILQYARLHWQSATGMSEAYMFSDAQAAAVFADAVADFRNALKQSKIPDVTDQTHETSIDNQQNLPAALQGVAERLIIHINAAQEPGTSTWQTHPKFNCRKCGGSVIDVPDNHTDDSIASCQACGAEVGRLGDLVSLVRLLGEEDLRRRGVIPKQD